ncbi:octanoyltransferase [mine drainage metagenome]|uniref:lipoyl(octanoyl) transferase n=1 Tax=mine drainage metagenome TaxID=410659 RepID=A0A1J5QM84_9ZZZZ
MLVRKLGLTDYETTWQAMQSFTAGRDADTPDELWLTEHPPVYTQGLNRRDVRPPWRDDIPLLRTDRGGKITYHGPGQIVLYILYDLKRRNLPIRSMVDHLEGAIISLLASHGISARNRPEAPGVYVGEAKIASLGLRLKNGCCYHGLSLNVAMDLSPFSAIDPCGHRGLQVTQTRNIGIGDDMEMLASGLITRLLKELG